MRDAALLTLPDVQRPDAVRRALAADLRTAVMAAGRALAPGAGLGLYGLAAALDRRTPFDAGDIERLREALATLLGHLAPSLPTPSLRIGPSMRDRP